MPRAIVDGFLGSPGHLGDRLSRRCAPASTPAAKPARSTPPASSSCATSPWPVADLRIDWTEADPVAELAALWALYRPQLDAYVTRALDPTAAPSYGVPGDE